MGPGDTGGKGAVGAAAVMGSGWWLRVVDFLQAVTRLKRKV